MAGEGGKTAQRRNGRVKLLTEQELAFVRAYVADPQRRASEAAKVAGWSKSSAPSTASRLLRKPAIIEAIEAATKKAAVRAEEKFEITLDKVVEELAKIAFFNPIDVMTITADGDAFLDLSELTRDQAAAIGEFIVEDYKEGRGKAARDVRRVKVKFLDKKGALVDLGRHLGGFNPKAAVDLGDKANTAFDAFVNMVRGVERSAIPVAPNKPKRGAAS